MALEEIYLEIAAKRLRFEIIKPPFAEGKSATSHRFSYLVSSGERRYGFDIVEEAGVYDVLGAYIKQFDTGVRCCIVSMSGKSSNEARALASKYGMRILTSAELQSLEASEIFGAQPLSRLAENFA